MRGDFLSRPWLSEAWVTAIEDLHVQCLHNIRSVKESPGFAVAVTGMLVPKIASSSHDKFQAV